MLAKIIYRFLPIIAMSLNQAYQLDYEVPTIRRFTINQHLTDLIGDFAPVSFIQNKNKKYLLSIDRSLNFSSKSSSMITETSPTSTYLSSYSPSLTTSSSYLSLTSSSSLLSTPSSSLLSTSSSMPSSLSTSMSLPINHNPSTSELSDPSFDYVSSSDSMLSSQQHQQKNPYKHQSYYSLKQHYNVNNDKKNNNLNINNKNTNSENDRSNYYFKYDIESYYQQNPLLTYHQSQKNPKKSTSTTTPIPLIKLHNTKVGERIAPTLVITLPKKRKSNGKSRRFLFLKAIVNSLISPEKRANLSSQDKQQKHYLPNSFEIYSSKQSKNGNLGFNSVSNNVNLNQKHHSQMYFKKKQLDSHQLKHAIHSSNNGNSGLNTENNGNNIFSNGHHISIQSQQSYANVKEELPKLINEFDDELFQLPFKDQLEEDDEEEFNEHSDAPQPHNFDENQFYIESKKLKYLNGRNSNYMLNNGKRHDLFSQSYVSQKNNVNNHNNANAHQYTTKSNQDIEIMTSEVIDQEENEYSEKRPSISVRSRGSFLISVLSRMMKSVNFTMITEDMRLGSSSRASCLACHALVALYLSPFYSKEAMVNAARTICISFRLQPARVCTGLIDSFKDDLDYIRTHTKLNRREMCGVLFGLKCSRITTHNLNWIVAIPNRPNVIERRMMKQHNLNNIGNLEGENNNASPKINKLFTNYSIYHLNNNQNTYSNIVVSSSNLNTGNMLDAVQITDIHVDPYYAPGTNADCGEPLCCRATSGLAKMATKTAGVWGDYRNCDTPIITLRNVLKQISNNHANANYWMWTGDIAPHDIWNITRNEVIYQLRLVTNMIKEYSKVPVFPVIGNHEGVPVNSFPPPEVKGELSVSWLYDEVAKQWSYWLPPDAVKTLRFGGYYMVKVKPGFRIISLNTNYCTRLNPWTLYDPVDPGNQLKWLVKELHAAELAGDKVHILGHIPPDNRECTQAWLNNFLRILDRFEHIVLAQYYGHTHRDEFRVLYSPHGHGLRPISVAYIGPSITPFTENNPAYRVYSMNGKGYIQDHHTYYFNLTEANHGELGVPIWRHEYSAMQTFHLKNLGPEGWHNLISRLMEDDLLFNKYHKMYFRWSQTRYKQICLDKCRQALLNDLIVAHPLKTKPRRLFGSRKH